MISSYGYGVLGLGLWLLEIGGDPGPAQVALEQAATALEAVMAKGDHPESDPHGKKLSALYRSIRVSAFDEDTIRSETSWWPLPKSWTLLFAMIHLYSTM